MYVDPEIVQRNQVIVPALRGFALEHEIPLRMLGGPRMPSPGIMPDWTEEQAAHATPWLTGGRRAARLELARERGVTVMSWTSSEGTGLPRFIQPTMFSAGTEIVMCATAEEPTTPIQVECADGMQTWGEIHPRVVYDWWGATRYHPSPEQWDECLHYYAAQLCDAVELSLDPELQARSDNVARERVLTALQEFQPQRLAARLESLRAGIANVESAAQLHLEQYWTQMQRLKSLRGEVDFVLNGDADEKARATLIEDYKLLLDHPRAASVCFANGVLTIVTTDDLRLTREDTGESRWLGAFRIKIDLNTQNIQLYNLSTPRNGRQHPHVTASYTCLGGHADDFRQLMEAGEVYMLFELLIQYLETLNLADDWGAYGAYWFDVPDARPLEAEVQETTA